MEGVAVSAAHEAVADETDAELFLGHREERNEEVKIERGLKEGGVFDPPCEKT
jgi:hypothetical protein